MLIFLFSRLCFSNPLIPYPAEQNNHPDLFKTASGQLAQSAQETILTIPNGYDFLITTYITGQYDGRSCVLSVNGNSIAPTSAFFSETGSHGVDPSQSAFISGIATEKVVSGDVISVENVSPYNVNCSYYFQGRFVEENSPYFSYHGSSSTVFTNSSNRALIKTVMIHGGCDLKIDNVVVVQGSSDAALLGNSTATALKMGNGLIVVEPNSTVQVVGCSYYIAGVYLN